MSKAGLMPVEDALDQLLGMANEQRLADSELLPLDEVRGRVLASDLVATLDLPPWPNSAMDGYALNLADLHRQPLKVSQKVYAGQAPDALLPGTCARIFTGAPLPPGATCVEMQENVEVLEDGRVRFLQPLKAGQNIRAQGQENRVGDILLRAGKRLGPFELAVAAGQGLAQVHVVRRPRVALLSTGDELVEPGLPLRPGSIYNSNRVLLGHWLKELGCEVIDAGILPDRPAQTRLKLEQLQVAADLILTTGGVSAGDADCLGQVLREDGKPLLWKLAIKPGKPLTVGHFGSVPVIGLPGNPTSALVTFGLLARPYLLRIQGVEEVMPLSFTVNAGFAWNKAGSRREYLRVRLEAGRAVLYPNQSSGVLLGATWADGLVEVPENSTHGIGDPLRFIPFSELF
ncbi:MULTISPECIES: molybdopterin molybdotransferase MoeA [unclassified Pseudomonas]|uniref:molybdopterin molybdotransferase MoeA n=1 Tax=unclassified Pseudomonas TaxID=196821 RepID=UPI000CD04147|nr:MULTISPECIES: gephyrin-like molybdotransferase Glp [unclassified Pseudomonas]POA26146.1 molybdopterin molybdenumtransferase MoeA [Pseudomonas sp. FW305-3-2-15-E-TSA4]POA45630.1 molybdopterin molybdenumtransferase MoeA [Pseudomonas sp. FW305-3-2-15-E-TSA2]